MADDEKETSLLRTGYRFYFQQMISYLLWLVGTCVDETNGESYCDLCFFDFDDNREHGGSMCRLFQLQASRNKVVRRTA